MALYTVEVRDQYGRLVTVLQRPMNKQWRLYRNRSGSCQFTLDAYDPQATDSILQINQYDIVFRRQGTPVFAGQISYVNPTIDSETAKIEVIATGYFDLLDYRVITEDFPGYDALHQQLPYDPTDTGQIAWSLINYTQFPLSSDGSVKMQGATPTLNQSFIAQGTANVQTLKLYLQNVSATGNLVVAIYSDSSNAPGSIVPNSEVSIAVGSLSSSGDWYTITYGATPPALTAGQRYWIKAYLETTQTGSNGVNWFYLANDYYGNGRAYSPENPGLFTSQQDLQFFVLLDDNSYQMTKNTYLGLNQGTINTSFNLTPVYPAYKKIKQAVEDLANTYNGMDFNFTVSIDPDTNYMARYFNVFYPRQGVDNTSLNFSYPGNIIKFSKPKDGKTMFNEVIMRGQGTGLAQLIITENDKAAISSFGMRQETQSEPDVSDQDTLTSIAQESIRTRKDPLDLPEIQLDGSKPPYIGSYGVGDTIQIQITGVPILNVNDSYRIEQLDVTISDDDQEFASILVSKA